MSSIVAVAPQLRPFADSRHIPESGPFLCSYRFEMTSAGMRLGSSTLAASAFLAVTGLQK